MLNWMLDKKSSISLLIASLLITTSSQVWAKNQCSQLFVAAKEPYQEYYQAKQSTADILFKIFKKTTSNPTNRRQESKNTVKGIDYNSVYQNLVTKLAIEGITVGIRDAITAGYNNVTKTFYSRQIRFSPSMVQKAGFSTHKEIRGVIRQRKYGLVKTDQKIALKNMIVSDFTQEYSFYEFKFKDPEFENSVLKPRAYIADLTYKRLVREKISNEDKNQIILDILKLKPNKSLTVDEVTTFVDLLLSLKDAEFNFDPVLVSFYNRTSKSVRFMNDKTKDIFEVQITEDSFVSAYRQTQNQKFEPVLAHNDDTVVIETKVPVDQLYLKLPDARADYIYQKQSIKDLELVPGFKAFLEFKADLANSHVESAIVNNHVIIYQANKGKKGLLQSVNAFSTENISLTP